MSKMMKAIKLEDLPECVLLEIFAYLNKSEKLALALSSKHLNSIVRRTKRTCDAIIFRNEELQQITRLLSTHTRIENLKIFLSLFNKNSPILKYLVGSPTIQSLSLQFSDVNPSQRALQTLHCNFQQLTSLELHSSAQPKKRLNLNGSLSSLSSLSSLRSLRLTNLGSDAGLEHLTQVTSLAIKLPNHGEASHRELACPVCQTVHEETMYEWWHTIEVHSPVIVGYNIQKMPHLQQLVLDYNVNQLFSANSFLNMFRWNAADGHDDKEHSLIPHSDHGPAPTKRVCFPSLTHIHFLNTGHDDNNTINEIISHQFFNPDDMPDIFLPDAGKCADAYLTSTVWKAFSTMPRLKHWCVPLASTFLSRLGKCGKVWFPCHEIHGVSSAASTASITAASSDPDGRSGNGGAGLMMSAEYIVCDDNVMEIHCPGILALHREP